MSKEIKDADYADNTAGLGSGCTGYSVKAVQLLYTLLRTDFW